MTLDLELSTYIYDLRIHATISSLETNVSWLLSIFSNISASRFFASAGERLANSSSSSFEPDGKSGQNCSAIILLILMYFYCGNSTEE